MRKTKILSIVLSVLMIMSVLPMSIFAADSPVAQIGDTTYTTLESAITAAASGDTITLIADTTLKDNSYSMPDNITINLNGHTVTMKGSNKAYARFAGKNITIENGEIVNGGVYALDNTTLTLNEVEIDVGTNNFAYAVIVADTSYITINSGKYHGGKDDPKNDIYGWTLKANITVNGGTFVRGLLEKFVADGCVVAETEEGYAVVNADDVVATIGATNYIDLAYAISDAEAGETIELVKDTTLKDNGVDTPYSMPEDSTIDLNDKTVTINGRYARFEGDNITIMNGNIAKGGVYAANADLTLENTNITADQGTQEYAVMVDKDSNVTIDGGHYSGSAAADTKDVVCYKVPANLDIVSGTFDRKPLDMYAADGYAVAQLTDSTYYTVVEVSELVASVGKTNYTDLQFAIEKANDGDTIKLLKSITIEDESSAYAVMPDNSTFDLNGNTITIKGSYARFKGNNISIKNGEIKDGGIYALKSTTLTLEDATITVDDKEEYAVLVDDAGEVVINGGTYTGGTYNDQAVMGWEMPANVLIHKGTFNKRPYAKFVATTSWVNDNYDGTYTVNP